MKTECFSISDLSINPGDIEELMSFEPGNSPAPFPELIATGLEEAPGLCNVTGGYQIFSDIIIDANAKTITIGRQLFHPGSIVVTHLGKARHAALFLCTAGAGITDYSRQVASGGDELYAYVLDVIGTVVVDKAAGCLLGIIQKEVSALGYGITESFSPGYCNWNVAEQQKLFSLLPPGACNISLSPTSLMHPVKSVSGITGIGIGCEPAGYQCEWCPDINCINRKVRRSKKAKKNL